MNRIFQRLGCGTLLAALVSAAQLMTVADAAQGRAAAAAAELSAEPGWRIVGGNDTRDGDWPSVLSVVNTFPLPDTYDRHYCGATLIAPGWALTAAHCLFQASGSRQLRPDELRVVGGFVDLDDAQPDDESAVVAIYIHPDYDNDEVSSPNDLGLIELAEPLDLPVISLYRGDKESLDDLTAHIVGWGALTASGQSPEFSAQQQMASVPVVPQARCNAPQSYDGLVGSSQLCAGFAAGGVDACAGDSGGPLIIGIEGYQVQIGVVSFGSGCAEPDHYGIYTHIASFEDWISDYVAADFRTLAPTPVSPPEPPDGGSTPVAGSGGGGGAPGWLLLWCWLLPVGVRRVAARRHQFPRPC